MSSLNGIEYVIEYLKTFYSGLNSFPSDFPSFCDKRYFIESVRDRCFSYPAGIFSAYRVYTSCPTGHILVVIGVNVFNIVYLVVYALYKPVSIFVIVRTEDISVSVRDYPALYLLVPVKIEKQSCVSYRKLSLHHLVLHSVLVSQVPILLEESEVLVHLFSRVGVKKRELHRVPCKVQQLLVLDYLLNRKSHSCELDVPEPSVVEFYAKRRDILVK